MKHSFYFNELKKAEFFVFFVIHVQAEKKTYSKSYRHQVHSVFIIIGKLILFTP